MTFFVNLHRLPGNTGLYTCLVESEEHPGFYEEVDVLADANATAQEVMEYVDLEDLGLKGKIVAIADQSRNEVLMDGREKVQE